jgi:hypothetical protein
MPCLATGTATVLWPAPQSTPDSRPRGGSGAGGLALKVKQTHTACWQLLFPSLSRSAWGHRRAS